jgi:hypothetical protein
LGVTRAEASALKLIDATNTANIATSSAMAVPARFASNVRTGCQLPMCPFGPETGTAGKIATG